VKKILLFIQKIISGLPKRFRLTRRSLQLVWEASKKWTLLWGILLLIQGLIPGGIVYVTKGVVDTVNAAVGNGMSRETVEPVLFSAMLMGGLLLGQQVIQRVIGWLQGIQGELVQDVIRGKIHQKAAKVDYGFYESPEFFDLLKESDTQASQRAMSLLQNVGGIVQSSITFLSIAVILAVYSFWLPVILFLGTLPAFIIVVRQNRIYHSWWKRTTKDRRWAEYLNFLFVEPRFAAEMRLYNLGDYLRKQYNSVRQQLRSKQISLMGRQTIAGIVAAGQGLIVIGGIMLWMIWRAVRGLGTLGDIALFYQAVNQGQTLIRSVLNNLGSVYTNSLFVEHLFRFLEIDSSLIEPERPESVPVPIQNGVKFNNITFTYPGSKIPALENFNLTIPQGKITALVGANGAGKTTAVKLLCRFYDPQEGKVTIDGIDLRKFSKKELREHISIMFQYPVRYQATANENIALGKINTRNGEIVNAARDAKAHEFIEKLPDQYETLLGRLFPGGTELSGGQWQRIALARAFLRQGQLVVLDEPTSFMDSWSEMEWLQKFRELVDGRTALVITHRFTTAMQADIIHVMEKGKIIESGSHEELMSQSTRYAESWHAQVGEKSRVNV